eukprot:s1746_g3.t3
MASLKRVKRCVSPLLRPSICLAMQRCLLVPVSFAVFVVAGAGSSSPANARTRRAAGGFLHPRPQREDEEEEVEELQGCDCRTRQQGQRVRSLASAAGRLPKACPEGCTRPDAQHLRAGALLLPNSTDTDTVGTEGTEQLKRALRAWLLEASANPWLDPLKEATSRGGRRLAGGCPANSLLEAMSEADTCEITAVERAERGSNAGKESGLLEFLTIGECSYVAFLIYGAILGSLSGMGPGTLAIIGIVLVCWPIAACKVCCRCCRKCCCSCCREGKEVRKIGNVKKIVILLLSLAGLGGMAALPMAGIMGDVKAGSAVANSADCASREFLRSALGDVTAIGNAASVPAGGSSAAADPDPGSNSSRLLQGASFIGIATAGQEVQTVSTAVDALATAATQAAAQDNGAADHVAESLAILRLMQDSLSGQISIGGSTCTFCQTCCGTQAGALVPQLLSQLEGTPSRVTTLSADFQEEPGSRISSLKAAVVSAGAALSLLQQSFQAGPAAALILGSDLFVDPVQEMVVMGFEFGAVPIAGDGFFYSPSFLSDVQVQALRAAVESGPSGDETISTGRPLAATPGVHWHGFPRPHSRHESEITILDACGPMLLELRERGILPPGYWFDQAIVNFYSEGDGIPMHVDRANFDDYIVGFSLGAPVVMDLEPLDLRESFPAKHEAEEEGCEAGRAERSCGQQEGSVYVFSGKVRWKWKHGIRPNCRYQGQELPVGCRTSVTFRRLRRPGLTGIGLVFLFYSLHWCCCLRRCKIDRKDHPAPQWAACGWCGGCLGALLAALLGIVTFASAAVGSEFCIMMDTLSASDGLDRYSILLGLSGDSTQVVAARSASLACLGPAADVPSRDLFPMLGLSAPVQGLSDMAADLSSLLSFDFTPLLTQYQTLNAQAQSSATTFTPTPADATSQVYTCYTWISLAQAPTSTSCDLPTFQANMQTLAQLALQSGQDASAALGSIRQSSSVWQSTLSDMQALTAHPSLAALQSGLDCAEVFDAWQVANDQACAGLADTFSTSGFVWLLAGACGFVGAIGQYWIWRNLKDNRTLFFDEHEDMKPRGMKKLFCCFCATSVGDDLDAGKTQAEEAPKEPSEKATSRSKSTGGAKTSVASKRIAIRFFEAFEMSVEENVKAFLRDELYPSYDESFKNMAVADRMASWKALEKQKQSGGDVEVQPPGEQPTDPATLFSDYGERGPDGVPTADSEGKPLDKKKLAALKKDLALLQKPWDKWQNDKRKYEAYLLSKIRKQCLEKYAEVQYTEEVEHLRPLSPTSRTENDRWPLKEAAFSGQAEVLEAVTSALRASLTMAAPWKCQCGQQCKAAAEYCSKCGLHWRQAGYPTYAAPPAQHDGGGWWRTRSPRSRGEGGKGKAKRPLSPRQRGRGKSGQQEPKGGAAPSGKGKGAEVSTSTSTAYMKQVPTVPVLSQPAQPPAVPSMDGQEKLPQTVQDILNSLSSSKEALPAEVRTVLEAHMETSHHHATKQLHKLVAQQSRAQKELLAIQKSRGIFVQEWSSYLDQLTQLLQKQVQQKEESLAALAASEAGWQEQLATATRAIRQQTSATSSAQSIVDSSEEEQQAMEAEVEVDAAADASRQAAIEQSKLREANLIMALQSATAASAAQAQQYRERTPRRRKSEDKEPEAKKEEMAPAAKGDVTPPGKAQ